MDILIIARVSAAAALVSAAATVVIAIFTYQTIQVYRQQVQVSQDQVRVSQEQVRVSQDQVRASKDQQLNQFRPVLNPTGGLGLIVEMADGRSYIQWDFSYPVIGGLRNIGVGPAFNIYGILFGPLFNSTPPRKRYVVWNYASLSPDQEGDKITLQQFSSLSSTTMIGGYSLYVPVDIEHQHIIARFTLTYHDVFERKHASIYDYNALYRWMWVAHCPDIEYDIRELEQQNPTTQTVERFHYEAGKRARS